MRTTFGFPTSLRLCFCGVIAASIMFFALGPNVTMLAQVATASINGIVKDPTGAAIPAATVSLTNVATGVTATTKTNSVGQYVILNIPPGNYTLTVVKTGFETRKQSEFALNVNQTTTFDFTLTVGSTRQSVTVQAAAAQLETSTADLGTAITQNEVNDLPLNGRNFTQLLALTPGVSILNTSQNSGGFDTNPTGVFVIPSVGGQTNRSDFFMLDGLNDEEVFNSTYSISPIVDDIQEFKVVSHTDSAQFGGVLGGIINVVTKSGTNQVHGTAWEFMRNNALDSRDPFVTTTSPLVQNQFGANVGGPVVIPHVYNGKNRTFFFASYEGDRIHSAGTDLDYIPTPAEINGDFSQDFNSSGQLITIYNPYTTTPDPTHPGEYLRTPFPGNIIPTADLNTNMVALAKLIYPAAYQTSIPGVNYEQIAPEVQDTNQYSLRGDEQLGAKNSFWVRFTHLSSPTTYQESLPGFFGQDLYHAYQTGGDWTHIFGPTTVLTVEFGRNYGYEISGGIGKGVDAGTNFASVAGFAAPFACDYTSAPAPFSSCEPGLSLAGYTGAGVSYDGTSLSDVYEENANLSKIVGHHTFTFGTTLNESGFISPIGGSGICFTSFQTTNLETSAGGDSVASFLLGVPDGASRRDVQESEHEAYVNGFFGQDSWKATDRLTVNLGVRYDYSTFPAYGLLSNGSAYAGDYDLNNGTYVLQDKPPSCTVTEAAPCIPNGVLPAHVVVSTNGKIYHTPYDDIQPRAGFAYRLGQKNVIRVSGGRFYDEWAANMQTGQNYEGTWPGIGELITAPLNQTTPVVTAENPVATTGLLPAATPFNQVTWFASPYLENPESWQWNAGIQRQLTQNTVLTVNYAGSADTQTDIGDAQNTPLTPGPGNPQSRAPYNYITPTFYDKSIGRATYNALQFSLQKTGAGMTYLISYTYSKAEDLCSDGWYGADGTDVENANDLASCWSVAGYNLTHALSASVSYKLPFGTGNRFSPSNRALRYVTGNWQVNGILSLSSGVPYNIFSSDNIPNEDQFWENGNQVLANTGVSNPSPTEWFNTKAFASPAEYTYGNVGRNSLTSDWLKDFDFSIFRDFPFGESKKIEFRADAFNLGNWPVWGVPDDTTEDPSFGRVLSTENTAREFQFALKFYW